MTETAPLHTLFGGTFDPIHYGHLHPVAALAQQIGLQQITLLPNNVPPHRPQPKASATQRVAMIKLAITDQWLFHLDERELKRAAPSWTVETLSELRKEYTPQQPLAFIIGQDSLLSLHTWHRWQKLLSLCHLLVCKRPGYPVQMPNNQQQWLDEHLTHEIATLHNTPAGKIFLADTPYISISASEIRQRCLLGDSLDNLLPSSVIAYIEREKLYTE